MQEFLSLWWVLPSAIAFSTLAIGSGISGALFFSPFFMLVVGLAPAQAVGAGLLTEVFGMGNGLRSYVRQRAVDYATARWILVGALPSVVIGAMLAHRVPARTLKVIFGCGLLVLAGFLVLVPAPSKVEREGPGRNTEGEGETDVGETVIQTRDGAIYRYTTCWHIPSSLLAAVGGALTGLVSAGLPELSTTQLVVRCRVPPRVAVATSVFCLALTATLGAAIHAMSAQPAWHVVGWSIPGVLVGSTVGSRVGRHLPAGLMVKILGALFGAVGVLVVALEIAA